ncbi:c-type cytochrome [Bacteroides sp. K03]|uniref:cytochrome c peroxidase n=1 Tax=Bacteroides TaxID=816 RepID=UPI001C8C8D79|nr:MULTISPECIES: cytochrome c peroxidase [Bacteroides]MBX9190292.1 c-type cytochrome [Bacteroides sp. K03]
MKKSTKLIIASLVVVGFLAVTYCVVNRAPSQELTADAQMQEIITSGGCLRCHSSNPDLPFYADWPVVNSMIMKDVAAGYRTFDMTEMAEALKAGKSVGRVALAKVEKVMMDGKMPLHQYYMVHWGSVTTDTKKEMALAWVRQHRLAHYANGLAAAEFANEPIRPVADSLPVDMNKVILGDMLYHDTRLSADNSISCASCHGLNTGGVDNKRYSEGVGGQFGGVNAPTVYNAAYNFVQFWDGRANTLAEQAAGPPLNPVEMACHSFDEIIAKLQQDVNFTKAFTEVYPEGYSEKNITNAIEEFEKTLLTPNSRFDRYLKGEKSAINDTELTGYELFKKYDCATCHVGETLGGQSYELMGVKRDYFADRGLEMTEEDNGRFKQTKADRDKHRFKVPGLRNIALTAPYFHDGSMKTMKDAVDYMAKYQVDAILSDGELDEIVAFLETLTGEYKGKPLTNDNSKEL